MTLTDLAPFLFPPLLGAFIGYVTNHIAIRMLFRPLEPWRVFGVRLPLTPGVIPSKRRELARRIGEMVGVHLLTSDDVGRALEREGFRRELRLLVTEKLDGLLEKELGPAVTLVPADWQGRLRELQERLRWQLLRTIFAYLESSDFEVHFRAFLHRREEELLARDPASFITPECYQELRRHLDDRLGAFLRSDEAERWVGGWVDGHIEQWLASDRPLRELLPADLVELLLDQLEKELPELLEKLGGLLRHPDVRARLTGKIKEGIEGLLDSLGGLTAVMAAFINLDKVYARLPEFLDRAGDELSRWLQEERTRAEVARLLRERAAALLERPLRSYVEKLPYEKVAGARRFVREQAVAAVRSRRAVEALLTAAERGFDRIKDRPFGALLAAVLPEGGVERGRELLAGRLLAAVRSPEAREALDRILAAQAENWLYRRPLGRLSARLPADLREELAEALCRQLEEALRREVPPLVETLNVRQMVEEKVNSLDLLQVEGLLLGVMQEHFKYINLFGALLGFLLGLFNLLLLRLG